MRLELNFEIEKPQLPKDNKSIWVSFLKKSLSGVGQGMFFDKYFLGTAQKDYTFTTILSSPKFVGGEIFLDNNQIKMIFSADDRNKTGLIFFQAFIAMKQKKFPLPNGNSITLKKINQLREHLITNSKVMFRTVVGGGIVVRDHNRETNKDKFYTVADSNFEEKLIEILNIQAREAGFSESAAQNIKFTAMQCRKILVKVFGIYVDTTIGIFTLEANSDLLQYFYQAGLGSKHSQGYGLLDVISQE